MSRANFVDHIVPVEHVRKCQRRSLSNGRNLLAEYQNEATSSEPKSDAGSEGISICTRARAFESRRFQLSDVRAYIYRPIYTSVTLETTRFRSLRLVGATGFRARNTWRDRLRSIKLTDARVLHLPTTSCFQSHFFFVLLDGYLFLSYVPFFAQPFS